MKKTKLIALVLVVATMLTLLAGCGSRKYSDYAAAYRKVTANGGLDATITAKSSMEDSSIKVTGNLLLDSNSGKLLFNVSANGENVTQFSDGEYLYVDTGTSKEKFAVESQSKTETKDQTAGGEAPPQNAPEFNTDAYLGEFARFMEVGKIQELGLLAPLPEEIVTGVEYKDGVYTISVASELMKKLMNTLIRSESDGDDVLTIDEITNFVYTAKEQKDTIVSTSYSGQFDVTVPKELVSSGVETKYTLKFSITVDFNNPGASVTVDLPSTDGYVEK